MGTFCCAQDFVQIFVVCLFSVQDLNDYGTVYLVSEILFYRYQRIIYSHSLRETRACLDAVIFHLVYPSFAEIELRVAGISGVQCVNKQERAFQIPPA